MHKSTSERSDGSAMALRVALALFYAWLFGFSPSVATAARSTTAPITVSLSRSFSTFNHVFSIRH